MMVSSNTNLNVEEKVKMVFEYMSMVKLLDAYESKLGWEMSNDKLQEFFSQLKQHPTNHGMTILTDAPPITSFNNWTNFESAILNP